MFLHDSLQPPCCPDAHHMSGMGRAASSARCYRRCPLLTPEGTGASRAANREKAHARTARCCEQAAAMVQLLTLHSSFRLGGASTFEKIII